MAGRNPLILQGESERFVSLTRQCYFAMEKIEVDVTFIEANDTLMGFFFTKQQAVQPGDKEIIFRFEMSDTLVEAKFNLKDMLYKGQLAF